MHILKIEGFTLRCTPVYPKFTSSSFESGGARKIWPELKGVLRDVVLFCGSPYSVGINSCHRFHDIRSTLKSNENTAKL